MTGGCRARTFPTLVLAMLGAAPLAAQGARDSLEAGKRAWERADFGVAARLLPLGLTAPGTRDTAWASGVHILLDALLNTGDSLRATLWAGWATRTAPALRPDSITFPPGVTQRLRAARAALTRSPDDTLAPATWAGDGDPATGRGVLRIARSAQDFLAIVDSIGTLLPGESRTLPAGTYTIRVTADGYAPYAVMREVLPGFATTVTVRLRRGTPGEVSAAAGAGATTIRGPGVAAAGTTTCAILGDARLVCWGAARGGPGGGDTATRAPTTLATDSSLAAVTLGGGHACALTPAGRALCWGQGGSGQLGHGQAVTSATPVVVAGTQTFVAVAAGTAHTCALTAAGGVMCWGGNRLGELGTRNTTNSAMPVAVAAPAGTTFTSLSVGGVHSCALAAGGGLWCWGGNDNGQVGSGGTGTVNAPAQVVGGLAWQAVAAGVAHTCAVAAGGAAWCWGANAGGQLGSGGPGPASPRPVQVTGGLTSFTAVVAGDAHTCALTSDGAAYCWGAGQSGQLGNGQHTDSPRPVLVVGGHTFATLSLGSAHTCGTTAPGVTWCWGDNAAGQVGSLAGRDAAAATPVLVRPALRTATGPALAQVRETFTDDWRSTPAWRTDSVAGARLALADGALSVSRTNARGMTGAAGLSLPVRIAVTRATALQFDVMVEAGTAPGSCGLNCASWPATVRLLVKNSDLTQSEVWFAFSSDSGAGGTLGNVVIVGHANLPRGVWRRRQQFTIRDHLPRADSILGIALGGIGTDFGARYDNLIVPVSVPAVVVVEPPAMTLTAVRRSRRVTAVVRDAEGAPVTGVTLAWSSSDTAVARVSASGLVTAMGPGSAVVRATAGSLSDSVRVRSTIPARRPARGPARRP